MAIPGDRQDTPPQPTDRLPELTPAEQAHVIRLARLCKSGLITSFSIEAHDQKECLESRWAEAGGGRLVK